MTLALRNRIDPGPDILPTMYTSREASAKLRIGTRLLWTLTNCREIEHVRIGRKVLYTEEQLVRFVASRMA